MSSLFFAAKAIMPLSSFQLAVIVPTCVVFGLAAIGLYAVYLWLYWKQARSTSDSELVRSASIPVGRPPTHSIELWSFPLSGPSNEELPAKPDSIATSSIVVSDLRQEYVCILSFFI